MITVGMDPGLEGAIAVLHAGAYVALLDMPVVRKGEGKVKNEVNPAGVVQFLNQHCVRGKTAAIVERVGVMPSQGAVSAFSLGDSSGALRGILAAMDMPYHMVTPQKWKKFYHLESDKEQARAYAARLFPQAELHLKKHADRAEALLLANYLWLHNNYKDPQLPLPF